MLTRKSKYALKALAALARSPAQPVSSARLAVRERIPRKFLEAILRQLTEQGLLRSRRGPGGGYLLARPAAQVAIGPLLRGLEGPLAPVPCVSETDYHPCEDCEDEPTCRIRKLMREVRDASAAVLDRATLEQLSAALPPLVATRSTRRARLRQPATPEAAAAQTLGKSRALIVHGISPFNAGPPPEILRQRLLTPTRYFFVRNHGTVPQIAVRDFRLTVDGLVARPLRFSLRDLQRRFPPVTLHATLMCAGNRRNEFDAIRPIRGEVPWGGEAASNAAWTGVRLADVLAAAGVARGARHVAFAARDEVTREARTFGFGSSIPLEKARRDEVLLAWAMNGRPLPPAHGFPLRAVVPGFIGARSVKWLDHITLALEPSSNYFQRRAYKLFPPHVRAESADWRAGMSLAEQFTNVVICTPRQRQAAAGATVHLAGYALGGDGRTVVRVEVSPDDGRTWQPAAVERGSSPWTWCFWEASLAVPAGATRLWARAWDDHEIQPAFAADLWNFKGYMNNSWYCLHLA